MDVSPKIITITNNKGGVSKTTLSVNLGAALAKIGYKVCLIDCDTQGNLTSNLLKDYDSEIQPGIIQGLLDEEGSVKPSDIMYQSVVENLFVIPNERTIGGEYVSLSNELEKEWDRVNVLKNFLKDDSRLNEMDYVIIDTPPTRDLIVVNALCASTHFIIPSTVSDSSLIGLESCIDYTNKFRKINPSLQFLGVVLIGVDKRRSKNKVVIDDLDEGLEDKFFKTLIPINANFDDFVGKQLTIFDVPKNISKGKEEYLALAESIVQKTIDSNLHIKNVNRSQIQQQASM
jgi:chromosome partitioning protein